MRKNLIFIVLLLFNQLHALKDSNVPYAYPNPFFLKNNKVVKIIIPKNIKGKLSIEIYNIKGDLVKNIAEKKGSWVWDGKNDEGQKVRSGLYFVYINRIINKKKKGIKVFNLLVYR